MKPVIWLTEKEFTILSKAEKTERETVPLYSLPTEDKWKHFDEAYKKAHNSSHPEDWFQVALLAQQVRNEYFPTRTTYKDPDGVVHEYYDKS